MDTNFKNTLVYVSIDTIDVKKLNPRLSPNALLFYRLKGECYGR
ncbi:hypothetical protein [Helicobacter sp. 11S02629-2]|nr:hypothetical protein [Helicobacter sp. 11S02629-2]